MKNHKNAEKKYKKIAKDEEHIKYTSVIEQKVTDSNVNEITGYDVIKHNCTLIDESFPSLRQLTKLSTIPLWFEGKTGNKIMCK